MKKVLLIGAGAREHAMALALKQAKEEVALFVFASNNNPGIKELAVDYRVGSLKNNTSIVSYATEKQVDFAVIGPEAPLAEGVVNVLDQVGIKSVGPTRELAQIETSKSFARNLMVEYKIPGTPGFEVFENITGVKEFIGKYSKGFVIKPDGLTGGKGVKVMGDHFATPAEGLSVIEDLFANGSKVVLEEKLIGQEFSLMSFVDGEHLLHLPAVQDHKRLLNNDQGPNTGGMGSYSMANFSLPFLIDDDIKAAQLINESVALALKKKTGMPYKGILYGGFIATKTGVKLIEYNARLGDPEAMNVLSIFPPKTFPTNPAADFLQVCEGIINGNLNKLTVDWQKVCTICKYVVPQGYPENPVKDQKLDVSQVDQSKVKLFYASIDQKPDGLYLAGSRAMAVLAQHQDLYEAEKIVEAEINKIKGPVIHRSDIGTRELIEKRIKMMKELRN